MIGWEIRCDSIVLHCDFCFSLLSSFILSTPPSPLPLSTSPLVHQHSLSKQVESVIHSAEQEKGEMQQQVDQIITDQYPLSQLLSSFSSFFCFPYLSLSSFFPSFFDCNMYYPLKDSIDAIRLALGLPRLPSLQEETDKLQSSYVPPSLSLPLPPSSFPSLSPLPPLSSLSNPRYRYLEKRRKGWNGETPAPAPAPTRTVRKRRK